MNRVMLIGRLTAKPELRYTSSNIPSARFSLAVDRPFTSQSGERETDFINIVVWRKQAENVKKYITNAYINNTRNKFKYKDIILVHDKYSTNSCLLNSVI